MSQQSLIGKLLHGQLNGITSFTEGKAFPICSTSLRVRSALLVADSGNLSSISFGPTADADFDVVSPGQTYNFPKGLADEFFDLSDLYVKSDVAGQNYRILGLFAAAGVLPDNLFLGGMIDPWFGTSFYETQVSRPAGASFTTVTWTLPNLNLGRIPPTNDLWSITQATNDFTITIHTNTPYPSPAVYMQFQTVFTGSINPRISTINQVAGDDQDHSASVELGLGTFGSDEVGVVLHVRARFLDVSHNVISDWSSGQALKLVVTVPL